jgi:hypothetical protein
MTPPKCPICSTAHYGWQAHTFATNKSQVRLTERLTSTEDATNNATNSGRACVVAGDAAGQESVGQSDVLVASVRTANRRDRAAYNAYQREYMRKKRSCN